MSDSEVESGSEYSDEDYSDSEESEEDLYGEYDGSEGSDEDALMDDFGEPTPPVVLDIGSGVFKGGFAGAEMPEHCLPTIVGTEKVLNEEQYQELHKKLKVRLKNVEENLYDPEELLFGYDCLDMRGDLTLEYPVNRGFIENWDMMEHFIMHIFLDKMKIEPEETALMLCEPPLTSKTSRESACALFFETFGLPGINITNQSILSLFATGRTTGLVIDSGDQITNVMPIMEGYLISHASQRLSLGGRDVTKYLERLALLRAYDFTSSADHQFAREIKEELCYLSLDFAKDKKTKETDFEKAYELPDGYDIVLGSERFLAPEIMFNPAIMGKESLGIAEMAMKAFNICQYDVRKNLFKAVILSGGNTLLKNFDKRLEMDMNDQVKSLKRFKVTAPKTRQFSSWMGGSIIANLSTFEDSLVSLDDYEDYGANILHRKFGMQ